MQRRLVGVGGGALVCYLYCVVIKSNMGLYVSVCVSFNCKLSFASLCIWNCSKVFMSGPFFSRCNILSVF
jgi:hypothetical protein